MEAWKRRWIQILSFLFLVVSLPSCGNGRGNEQTVRSSTLKVTRLQIEGQDAPLGLDCPTPRISWNLESTEDGQRPVAYEIQAKGSQGNPIWNSGKVLLPSTLEADWAGPPLKSRDRVTVLVRVWDTNDVESSWSQPARFEMGLLSSGDWIGKWIAGEASQQDPLVPLPAPHLRRSFTLTQSVRKASAYVAGAGYFELHLNGQRVGDHVLDPAFTRYDRRLLYVSHDVTAQMRQGENVVGAILGNGFFNPSWKDAWGFETAPWRATPRLLLQLEIELMDGSIQILTSDEHWRTSTGPILRDAVRNGEVYDARLELGGWDLPGFSDTSWSPAVIVPSPRGVLSAQAPMAPIKIMETLLPSQITNPTPGIYLFDFGQSFAGWSRLNVQGPVGNEITLTYGERLAGDGTLDQKKIASLVYTGAFQTDRYIMKGDGPEVWEPRFVYHGFRYVQVKGLPGAPNQGTLAGRVVHTAFHQTGDFSCSDETLNAVFRAALWSYRSNFHGIPTDCPHREKNGWTADAHLAAEFGLLTFSNVQGYSKWMRDLWDEQRESGALPGIVPTPGFGYDWGNGPAWDSAISLIPWYVYLYAGDERLLKVGFGPMKKYIDYVDTISYFDSNPSGWLGDWNQLDQVTDTAITNAFFHVKGAEILVKAANLMGDPVNAETYRKKAAQVRSSFSARYLNLETGTIGNGTQTAHAGSLACGMIPDAFKALTLAGLEQNIVNQGERINAGVIGAKFLPAALTEAGRADLVYSMLTRTDSPSWGNWIAKGATTLWEDWGGINSQNHVYFADIAAWCMRSIAGLNPDPAQPGWKNIIFCPEPVAGMTWAQASSLTNRGLVSSRWQVTDGTFKWVVKVPVGSTATLVVPTDPGARISAPGATFIGIKSNRPMFQVGSGEHEVTVNQ